MTITNDFERITKTETTITLIVKKNQNPMKTYYRGKEITALFVISVFIILMIYSWLGL